MISRELVIIKGLKIQKIGSVLKAIKIIDLWIKLV